MLWRCSITATMTIEWRHGSSWLLFEYASYNLYLPANLRSKHINSRTHCNANKHHAGIENNRLEGLWRLKTDLPTTPIAPNLCFQFTSIKTESIRMSIFYQQKFKQVLTKTILEMLILITPPLQRHNFWLVGDTIRGANECYEQTQIAIKMHENQAGPFVLPLFFYNQRTV